MHTFLDSKTMAKALRTALAERQIDISHSDSLELVARQFGFDNWNILAARIDVATSNLVLPAAWIVGGGSPDLYRIGIDPSEAATVRLERIPGTGTDQSGFATLMQSIDAAEYVGRAIKLTALLRSEAAGKGALWMRIDPSSGGRWMRFDNMHQRTKDGPLAGDHGWVERSVVLDVPEGAGSIHYGIMLNGGGNLWARNVSIEEADPAAVTVSNGTLPRRPTNLGFGDAA
jgi:hypothetical protein